MFLVALIVSFLALCYSTEGCTCLDDEPGRSRLELEPSNFTKVKRNYTNYVCEQTMAIRAVISRQKVVKPSQHGQDGNFEPTMPTVDPLFEEHSISIENVTMFRNTNNGSVPTSVRTPGTGGMCGQEFREGEEYLILGYSSGDQISTTMCDHNRIWKNLPSEAIDELESGRLVEDCTPENSERLRK